MRALVSRAAQASCLLRLLSQRNVPRLAARLDEATRSRIGRLSMREWVCSSSGEGCAAALISAMVADHLASPGAGAGVVVLQPVTSGAATTGHSQV